MSERLEKPKASKRLSEEQLRKLYPDQQIVPDSLHWLPGEDKQAVRIVCQEPGCDEERTVRTSDLFQSKRCDSCQILAQRRAAKARRERKKAEKAANTDSSAETTDS